MKKTVLGVNIDDITLKDAVSLVEGWLKKPGKHYIVTPNPEFLVTANSDYQFQMILNRADLSVPDGVGLKLAGIKNTFAGVDLMEELIKMAEEKGYTIGFLGGKEGVAERAAECLKKRYPKLKITFVLSGLPYTNNLLRLQSEASHQPPTTNMLFIAFGHPKQEYWISENLDKISVKVAMGVGGAFDYISGKVPRAPVWMRSLGMEWLFRLVIQPWRVKRQIALFKYICMISKNSGLTKHL